LGLSIEEKLVKANIGPFLTKMRSAACHPLLPILQFKNIVNNEFIKLDELCSEDGLRLAMKWITQNKDTQCLLCLDGEPHFMCYPCGHSFCHNCMAKILKLNDGDHCLYCAKISTGYKYNHTQLLNGSQISNDSPLLNGSQISNDSPLLNGSQISNGSQLLSGSSDILPFLSPQFINEKRVKEILNHSAQNHIITIKMKWIVNKIIEIDKECVNNKEVHWLIFSQFTKPLDLLNQFLTNQGISTMQIDGRTKKDVRTDLIKEYQLGKYKVALLSLLAAGVGITLTRATRVIMFEPYWSDSLEDQGSDRCHRIGQTESVTVYNLCYRETVESNVFTMKDMKKEVVDGITGKRKYEMTSCNYANHVRLFMNSSILSQKVRRQ
jgi:SNF2 family DNA or RNA helicase